MIVLAFLLIGVITGIASGQSLIGVSLPCEETDRDPDANNPMNNLICPFTNETYCITTSQICDCINTAKFSGSLSGSGSGSGSGVLLGESDKDFVVHSTDCSKSLIIIFLLVVHPIMLIMSKHHWSYGVADFNFVCIAIEESN